MYFTKCNVTLAVWTELYITVCIIYYLVCAGRFRGLLLIILIIFYGSTWFYSVHTIRKYLVRAKNMFYSTFATRRHHAFGLPLCLYAHLDILLAWRSLSYKQVHGISADFGTRATSISAEWHSVQGARVWRTDGRTDHAMLTSVVIGGIAFTDDA